MTLSVGPRTPLADLLLVADEHAPSYATATPFPHVVIDGLFDTERLRAVAAELPRDSASWKVYDTATERKRVLDRMEDFGRSARQLADELNSSEFVRFLERLTGIKGLIPDPHLNSAGYFDVPRGGFLDIHVDYTRNRKLALVRRINVLVYLNEDWEPEWGGQLELWPDLESGPVKQIVPLLNRTVVFSTPDAPHGHPKPISAPGDRSRLCFSAYYFTSPVRSDPSRAHHGVKFGERTSRSRRYAMRRFVPPIVLDSITSARRKRRKARQAAASSG
ncbi:MAG: 2OG-Fe(II) oxygenase [Jiangellaceae bacterium]